MMAFLLLLMALGQVTDVARSSGMPESDRKLLEELSPHTGLTRTWILIRNAGELKMGRPDATYRTTLAFGSARQEQLIRAEVRRYGRLLLGYRQDEAGVTQALPTWVGYDAAGANAGILDAFYAAIEKSDLTTARQAAKGFVSNDLDVAARLAALEQKSGNASEAAKIVASAKDTAIMPKGLGDVAQKHLREDSDFIAANAIALIAAHRSLLASLVK